MYCKKCGAQIPDGNNFCQNCGTATADEAVEIIPENASNENVQMNESPPEQENAVPLTNNEIQLGEYYQPPENDGNINKDEVEENPPQAQTAFCAMCGKSIPIGEKLCADCINAQLQDIQNQVTDVPKPKKVRKPIGKKTKMLIISLSAIVLIALLAFGGFKLYQFIEQKRIDKITQSVESQIINMDSGDYSYVDKDGNVSAVEISNLGEENGCLFCITKYYLNTESGLLDDFDLENSPKTVNWVLYEKINRYDYTNEHSILYLSGDESVKVNLGKDYNIVSFEYSNIKYTKTESGSNTDKQLENVYDYRERLVACTNSNNIKKYEEMLRNSTFSNSGFSVPMDDALDTFFKSYTVRVDPDREDENIYHIYVSGPCYGYSYLYYAASGYSVYLNTKDVEFTYEYSEADDEMKVIDDDIDGYTLRYLYVNASLY